MIGEIIHGILVANSAVTALVDQSIFPGMAPEFANMPYITYEQVSKTHNRHKDRTIDKFTTRVQLDIIADNHPQAESIAIAVMNALAYYSGTVNSTFVETILFEDENDMTEIEYGTFRFQQDYIIKTHYTAPAPPSGGGNENILT